MDAINIVIVDDHQIVCDGIKSMVLDSDRVNVAGEAADHYELMQVLEKVSPDVIVLDISLPGRSGVEIARELKQEGRPAKVLMLSASTDEENIIESIRAGANGFLPKDTSREEFIEAIYLVARGEEYFGANLSKVIYKSYSHHVKAAGEDLRPPGLSQRETEILKCLADGLCSKEIACRLNISTRTVEFHRAKILEKLGLCTTADLIKYAIKQGIVKL